jgi:hypothetical protein
LVDVVGGDYTGGCGDLKGYLGGHLGGRLKGPPTSEVTSEVTSKVPRGFEDSSRTLPGSIPVILK